MPQHILTISKGPKAIAFASLTLIISLVFAWFSIRWQIGDMFADLTSSSSSNAVEAAELAKRLAPASPRPYWLSGAILKKAFDEPTLDLAIVQYEEAVRRSPYYYRSWTELGRVNEQAGRYEKAEAAFLKAAELAPEYTIPHWQAGNFYLRRGRIPEAITQLNAAAKHSSPYRIQVFSTAWSVLGNDPKQVEQFLTDSGDAKATLAVFYGTVDRPDDAIRIWNTIDPDSRPRYGWQVNAIARDLLAHRSYRGALEFSRQAGIAPYARPEAINNGDFELPVSSAEGEMGFDWKLVRIDGKVDPSSDGSVARNGKRSLRFALRGYAKPQFSALRQAIAVRPGERYRISFWVRTENLRSGSMPFIEARNAENDQILASSPAFGPGTNDWQQMNIDISVPTSSDGIYLISGREPCSDECPINGLFWLDDFSISRI